LHDGWADMTAELLEPMTYNERCDIHICARTVVSRLNIEYIYVRRYIHTVVSTPRRLTKRLRPLRLGPLCQWIILRLMFI
jgi:hypothetical protein